jgi:hypothetical protein
VDHYKGKDRGSSDQDKEVVRDQGKGHGYRQKILVQEIGDWKGIFMRLGANHGVVTDRVKVSVRVKVLEILVQANADNWEADRICPQKNVSKEERACSKCLTKMATASLMIMREHKCVPIWSNAGNNVCNAKVSRVEDLIKDNQPIDRRWVFINFLYNLLFYMGLLYIAILSK